MSEATREQTRTLEIDASTAARIQQAIDRFGIIAARVLQASPEYQLVRELGGSACLMVMPGPGRFPARRRAIKLHATCGQALADELAGAARLGCARGTLDPRVIGRAAKSIDELQRLLQPGSAFIDARNGWRRIRRGELLPPVSLLEFQLLPWLDQELDSESATAAVWAIVQCYPRGPVTEDGALSIVEPYVGRTLTAGRLLRIARDVCERAAALPRETPAEGSAARITRLRTS